ncbi:hypothetical protein ACQP1U_00605 [Actinomycetota bacterium]
MGILNNAGAEAMAKTAFQRPSTAAPGQVDPVNMAGEWKNGGFSPQGQYVKAPEPKVKWETKAEIGCPGGGEVTSCTYAISVCQDRGGPGPLTYLYRRPEGSTGAWEFLGETCYPARDIPAMVPAGAPIPPPPPVPTFAQIQQAFRELPFAKPSVSVQPVGNKTLVNLPTYFAASWPSDSTLAPGDISEPVQLLSWSVEFKIDAHSYNYAFGDGAGSGETGSAGGTYPDGDITHTYTKPVPAAKIHVDAKLTGQYRVNGGEWEDIETIADLQDEPVATLAVLEAHARLYNN